MLLLTINVTLVQHLGTINEINWHFLVGRKHVILVLIQRKI